MQIIVLGMHRSGTSLVTRLVNMMGAYFGPEGSALPANHDNPKGFWERLDIIHLNDALLAPHGCDWAHLSGLPAGLPLSEGKTAHGIQRLVMGMDAFRPWVMKDPRHCLTLPAWLPYLEVPVAIITHRDPLEIVRSLMKRNGLTPAHALSLWEYHAVGLLNASRKLPRIFVAHKDALADPVGFTAQLYDALTERDVRGLRLPSPREILAFIDPQLYRAQAEESLKLSPAQQQLCAILQGKQPQAGTLSVSTESAAIMRSARA